LEKRYRHSAGHTVWVLKNVSLVRNAAGAPLHLVVQVQDITEGKRAESDLAATTARLRLLLDSSGEGIYGIDTGGNCTFVNRSAAEMVGWRPDELVGRNMHQLLHHTRPDGAPYPACECPIFRAFQSGTCCRMADEVFWHKSGAALPVEFSSFPMVEGGTTVGAVIAFRDITARKAAEAALRASEERYRTLADHAPVGIFQADSSGGRVYHNRRWCELTGLSADEARGDGWQAAVHPADRARVLAAWDRVPTGSSARAARPCGCSGGSWRWGTARAGPTGTSASSRT
jgi:PAS domain S-box-containing protein